MRTKFTKIHMIGIGGSGMSGIAEVLLNLGYEVHGSDMADGPVVQRLRSLGADIHIGHAAGNVDDVNVLVKSSAVAEDNPEVVAARQKARAPRGPSPAGAGTRAAGREGMQGKERKEGKGREGKGRVGAAVRRSGGGWGLRGSRAGPALTSS